MSIQRSIETDFQFEEMDQIAEVESFRKEIYRPNYHIHKWWAQRLGSVFRAILLGALLDENEDIFDNFYKKHNFKDKIVLDPFMGSGTTIGEAVKLGCKTIGCDINPISTFMVKQSLQYIDSKKLIYEFNKLEAKVKPKIQRYYLKTHPLTNEKCRVLYYFWVKVVSTPTNKEIPLFSNYVFSKDAYPRKKPMAKILCPRCYDIIEGRYDSKYELCSKCGNSFNPQEGTVKGQYVYDDENNKKYRIIDIVKKYRRPPEHKLFASLVLTPDGKKEYLPITQEDYDLFESAKNELKRKNYTFVDTELCPGHNTNQAINYKYTNWKDFFNDRQLLCLSMLLEEILKIQDEKIRELFLCLFSGTLEFNNMFCSFKGEGTGAVRHMFYNHILKPEKTPIENSIWGTDKSSGTFRTLFSSRLLKANEYLKNPFELKLNIINGKKTSQKVFCNDQISPILVNNFEELLNTSNSSLILSGDSSKLPLPSKSVDAVITDPPYFDFVHYSELADFFYSWLSPVLRESNSSFLTASSRRSGEVQNKDYKIFSKNLSKVFEECRRVLKDDGLLIFSFHHSKIEGWISVYEALIGAGFYISCAYPMKAEMSVSIPKSNNTSPINLDSILVCKILQKTERGMWKEYKKEIIDRYNEYVLRFNSVNRILSASDKMVIYMSQILSVISKSQHEIYDDREQKLTVNEMINDIMKSLDVF